MKIRACNISLRLLYIILVLMFPEALLAQQTGLKLYSVSDGLPSSSPHSVYQDKYGYLWICSSVGLSRFDGRQFVNYNISDGLPSLATTVIFQDSRERLWVGTTAGMAQFQGNRFITYPTSDVMVNTFVFNFFETKGKKVWALTGSGVYEFGSNIWKKVLLYPGFENRPCRNIVEANGELFVAYPTDIVCRSKEGKWLQIASKNTYGSIFNVMSVQGNKILVSIGTGIYEIKNHQLLPVYNQSIGRKGYVSYLIDSKKRLWLNDEFFLKYSKPGNWQHFSDSMSHSGYASFVKEDSSHNIWTGTTRGLLKIKDIDFTIIDKNNKTPLDGIYNIIALPDNRIILSSGTNSGLLVYANDQFKQIMPPRSPGNENYFKDPIDAYTLDGQNTIWIATRFQKFLHFNGKTLEDFSATFNFKTTELIYDMHYVKKRDQFFVCADSTLLYGSSAKLTTFIPKTPGYLLSGQPAYMS